MTSLFARFRFMLALVAAVSPIFSLAGPVPANKPATYPDWWFERDVIPRLDSGNATPYWPADYPTADDFAAANQGQLKQIATKAAAEMNAKLPNPGAGVAVNELVDAWLASPALPPAPPRDDFAVINVGQLKAVAALFYARLNHFDPTISLTPWTIVTIPPRPPADDFALANLGQVKNLFSFSPATIADSLQAQAPRIILLAPFTYTTTDQATLTARVTLANGATLTRFSLNDQDLPASSGDSSIPVTLANGLNTFTLVATDNAGRSGTATVTITRDTGLPQLAITSPADGATIAASSISVLGTVTNGTPLRSVTVNGVSAYLNANTFEAPAISLVNGTNVFTVTATDVLGKVTTASITVTGELPAIPPEATTPPAPVVVTATPATGPAPLAVTFNVVATVPGTLLQVTYDFEGTGKTLSQSTTFAPMAHVYPEAGTYYPRITVRTSVGTFTNKTGPSVPVAERLRVKVTGGTDSPLVAWSNLKKWVSAGDFEAAAEHLSETHRDGLKAMSIDLGKDLATQMLTDFGELQQIALYDDVATYAGEITTPEGVITFLVDYVKESGSWKIYSY